MKNLATLRKFFNLTQEELAKKLLIDTNTVALYEAGKTFPAFKTLKKIINLLQVSYDFLLKDNECLYPKNLNLLKTAKKLDDLTKSEARSTIESNAKSLLGEKIKSNIVLKYDKIDIDLVNDFNSNLKIIRKYKKITQDELASLINIPRSSLSNYEQKNFPSNEKLIKLSEIFNISNHALITGEKLFFDFQDRHFGTTILLADHFLPLEEHKILIRLMDAILQTQLQPASS